jgi:GNAT superfamily N-acetyltransferase
VADFTIHRVLPEEWEQYKILRLEALADEPTAYGDTTQRSRALSDAEWEAIVRDREIFVAEADGVFIGKATGGYNDRHPGTHWLYGMYVTPAWRGQGVADALVGMVATWARNQGGTSLSLHVTQTLPRARGFYERMGFRPTGETFAMERDPNNVLMTVSWDLTTRFEIVHVAPTQLHELRRRVLRNNDPAINVADPRDDDATARHVAGTLDGRIVVCASVYPSTSPTVPERPTYQLRYMATDFDVQGQGFARLVLESIFEELRAVGVEEIWANGRDTAWGFYAATGWQEIPDSAHLSAETGLPHHRIFRLL